MGSKNLELMREQMKKQWGSAQPEYKTACCLVKRNSKRKNKSVLSLRLIKDSGAGRRREKLKDIKMLMVF